MLNTDNLEYIEIEKSQGKAIEDVYNGYEDLQIIFTDGTYTEIKKGAGGNARDI